MASRTKCTRKVFIGPKDLNRPKRQMNIEYQKITGILVKEAGNKNSYDLRFSGQIVQCKLPKGLLSERLIEVNKGSKGSLTFSVSRDSTTTMNYDLDRWLISGIARLIHVAGVTIVSFVSCYVERQKREDQIRTIITDCFSGISRTKIEPLTRMIMSNLENMDTIMIDDNAQEKRVKNEGGDIEVKNPFVSIGITDKMFKRLCNIWVREYFTKPLCINSKCSIAVADKVFECDYRAREYIRSKQFYTHCLNLPLVNCDILMAATGNLIDDNTRLKGYVMRRFLLLTYNTYYPVASGLMEEVVDYKFNTILEVPEDISHIGDKEIVSVGTKSRVISLGENFKMEVFLSRYLYRLTPSIRIPEDPILPLTEEQKEVCRAMTNSGTTCLIGIGGTGKSFVLIDLVLRLQKAGITFWISAYTGKACCRIREGFRALNVDITTISTLHAYIHKFQTRSAEVLIIDEASMVHTALLYKMIVTMKPECILLAGDNNQLFPLGRGSPFLSILQSDVVKVIELKTIMRAQGSLSHLCQSLTSGQFGQSLSSPSLYHLDCRDIVTTCSRAYRDAVEITGSNSVVIIVPTNDTRIKMNNRIHCDIAKAKGRKKLFWANRYPGDEGITLTEGCKIMFTSKNNYALGVFNGEIGTIDRVYFRGEVPVESLSHYVGEANVTRAAIVLSDVELLQCSFGGLKVLVIHGDNYEAKRLLKDEEAKILESSCLQGGECITIHKCLCGSSTFVYTGKLSPLSTLYPSGHTGKVDVEFDILSSASVVRGNELFYGGKRPCWTIVLENGIEITATKEHRLMTTEGWKRLEDIKCTDALLLSYGHLSQEEQYPTSTRFLEEIDALKYQVELVLYGIMSRRIGSTVKVFSDRRHKGTIAHSVCCIRNAGLRDVYDVHVNTKEHEFLANGILSHNSQSSEWDIVILSSEEGKLTTFGNFNLVYTAVSRARKKIMMVGPDREWNQSLHVPERKRYQFLSLFLHQLEYGEPEDPEIWEEQ